jgi:hypothetical protein
MVDGSVFDAFARRAAVAIDRKTSLKILGSAAITAVAVRPASAKKGGKKKARARRAAEDAARAAEDAARAAEDAAEQAAKQAAALAEARCFSQRQQCVDVVRSRFCARRPTEFATEAVIPTDPEGECVARLSICCDYFARCEAAAGFDCLVLLQARAATER